ncbi:aldehyde dehydrogenase family protein [Rhodococcus qingshengii]|uniref:aldehyde dehydrogenase family protein n=1 Tax=Rhodococcus qingshengii TaxID=334542 RepID=UPI001F1341B0|nr:aldehyde dehydrogenase family protein [Rhodococcus qingshengii]ULD38967.1 aldehyde dehydrogenase family protein [Rhodococcus qingshengii]
MTTTLVNHSKNAADIVAHAVTTTRAAAPAWAAAKRQPHLLSWKRLIHSRSDELIDLVCAETGKSHVDATVEVTLALEHLDWAARNASRVMSEQRVPRRLLAFNQSAVIRRQPFGVVGVIGPWNYPVFTPMGSISYALATGNAIVFKPSEYTPRTGHWLAQTFAEAVPQHHVFEFVIGDGQIGQRLCEADIDKLAFTGSGPTGRKVMAACAERLVPVVMELGGKDAAIIADDADLVAAARSVLWGATFNSGQSCAGIEIAIAVSGVYDEFLGHLTQQAKTLVAGVDYGEMTTSTQREIVERHVASAVDAGAQAVVGSTTPIDGRVCEPVILTDVPSDHPAMTDETFGPTVVVVRASNIDDAVAVANRSRYGLGAAVFSRRHGDSIARRLEVGMVSVNDVLAFGSSPELPFGGVKGSGFGRIHGDDGLREFTTAQAITRRQFRSPVRISEPKLRRFDRIALKAVGTIIGRT